MQKTNNIEDSCFNKREKVITTTILQARTGKTLEIENRVDPKLWYWTTVNNLKREKNRLKKEIFLGGFTLLLLGIMFILATSDFERLLMFILLTICILSIVFDIVAMVIPNHRGLKYYENMSSVRDDYSRSYLSLNINHYDYEFLDRLNEYTLVDFCVKENTIMFRYVDSNGDYRT